MNQLEQFYQKKIKLAKLLKEKSLLGWSSHDLLEDLTDEQSQQMLKALKKRVDPLSENQLFSLLHLADRDSSLLPGLISLSPEKLENIKTLRLGGSITEAMLNALEERAVPLTKDQLDNLISIAGRDTGLLPGLISLSPEKLAERLKSMKTLKEKFLPVLENHMVLKVRTAALQGY